MNSRPLAGCLAVTISVLVVYPIWYVLLFQILVRVEAEPWMWSAYWCYIPAGILATVISGWVVSAREED